MACQRRNGFAVFDAPAAARRQQVQEGLDPRHDTDPAALLVESQRQHRDVVVPLDLGQDTGGDVLRHAAEGQQLDGAIESALGEHDHAADGLAARAAHVLAQVGRAALPDPVPGIASTLWYQADVILNLSDGARDAVAEVLPPKVLCQPDCRGLCPQCGANRNLVECGCEPPADFRWEKLKGWKP